MANNKVNMTLRIDPDLKAKASKLFEALGLDLSTATGIFYRQALRCHGMIQPMQPWKLLKRRRISTAHLNRWMN